MKIKSAVLAACSIAALASGTQLPVANAAPYCGITWGSLAKWDADMSAASMYRVRTGRHACFDRLVIDVHGDVQGYHVRYVKNVTTGGEGAVVPLKGGAKLQVVATVAANDGEGNSTFDPRDPANLADVSGYRTFRQVAWGYDFEGYSTIGLGVRARLPFRVFILDGPGNDSRLVVDVAHKW